MLRETERWQLILAASFVGVGGALGCSSSDAGTARAAGGVPIDTAPSRIVFADTIIGVPNALAVVGNTLLVADATGETPLYRLPLVDSGAAASFGRAGDGPCEFRAIWQLLASETPDGAPSAWAYDIARRHLTRIELAWIGSKDGTQRCAGEARIVRLESDGEVTSAAWLSDSVLVTVGHFPAGRLRFFDSTGRTVATVGHTAVSDSVPAPVMQHAYQSSVARKPDGSLLAVMTRHASQLEIYRADGSLIARVDGPVAFRPVFEVDRSGRRPVFGSGSDLRFGYVAVAATQDAIYGLYSGRTRAEAPGEANAGTEIHTFTWAGELTRRIKLKGPALAIAVTSDGHTLYVGQTAPEPAVVAYELQ